MTAAPLIPSRLDPASAAPMMADLGFLAHSDLPDQAGPAFLLVALREVPSMHHYDPEIVAYWVNKAGRGVPRTLTRDTLSCPSTRTWASRNRLSRLTWRVSTLLIVRCVSLSCVTEPWNRRPGIRPLNRKSWLTLG